jgi:membrane fusion protein, multidrug efflux system
MKMFRQRVAIWIVLGLALSTVGCGPDAADEAASSTTAEVTPVTIAKVTRGNISRMVALTGSVAAPPNRDVRVSALVPGRIAELHVSEGDRVEAGQVAARIDDRTYQDQVQQAEAGVAEARATLENATLALARNQNLVERGIAARKDLEDATQARGVAQATLQQAEAALSIAQLQLARTTIASPIAGTIVKRFASVGEQVDGTSAQPIFEVANLSEVEINSNLPPGDLGRLNPGLLVHFTSDAFPGRTFSGRVVAISPAVDPTTNTGLVRIGIANPGGLLRIGMFVSAQLSIETHTRALRVPPAAVYRDEEGQPHVYVVSGDTANAAEIELGLETSEFDEVLSGVMEGDTVILSGGYGLPDQAKVSVQNPGADSEKQ